MQVATDISKKRRRRKRKRGKRIEPRTKKKKKMMMMNVRTTSTRIHKSRRLRTIEMEGVPQTQMLLSLQGIHRMHHMHRMHIKTFQTVTELQSKLFQSIKGILLEKYYKC